MGDTVITIKPFGSSLDTRLIDKSGSGPVNLYQGVDDCERHTMLKSMVI